MGNIRTTLKQIYRNIDLANSEIQNRIIRNDSAELQLLSSIQNVTTQLAEGSQSIFKIFRKRKFLTIAAYKTAV